MSPRATGDTFTDDPRSSVNDLASIELPWDDLLHPNESGGSAGESAVHRYFRNAAYQHDAGWMTSQSASDQGPLDPGKRTSKASSGVVVETVSARSNPSPHELSILPDGLLYKSYLAGPHEPRISTVIFSDTRKGIFWDATLGGRVGLLRYGSLGPIAPEGWQWDLEGAVMVRLDVQNSEDVESMDFRFGTLITHADGPWSAKAGYFHISSHAGDEYMERFPLFERVNYVTESLIAGISYKPSEPLRLYGEFAYAVKTSGGAKPIQVQTGIEYVPQPLTPQRGGPFSAVNLDIRETVDFSPTMTLQTGWQWQGQNSQRRIRFGLQYLNGYTTQFEFFDKQEEQLGVGSWFDY